MRTIWIKVDLPSDDDQLAMAVDDIADGMDRFLRYLDPDAGAEVLDELPGDETT